MRTYARQARAPDDCICGAPMHTEWRDHTFTYGADESAVELNARVPVDVCASCGSAWLGHEGEEARHEAVCAHHGVLTPREIVSLRKRHRLSRAAFAGITGLGEATLRRWETGAIIQNRANDRYLRLLDDQDNMRALQRLGADRKASVRGWKPSFRCLRDPGRYRQDQADFWLRAN